MNLLGKIVVVTGGMKSGKSEEVLRRYRRAQVAGVKAQIFKPDTDKEFKEDKATSRDNRYENCVVVPAENAEYILSLLEGDTDLVVIDEVQFFKKKAIKKGEVYEYYFPIVDIVQDLADRGINVVVSGLDMDSNRVPFGPVPYLMAIAHEVRKLHAICEICHEEASYSYANFNKKEKIVVGDKEYIALCKQCYVLLKDDNLSTEQESGRYVIVDHSNKKDNFLN